MVKKEMALAIASALVYGATAFGEIPTAKTYNLPKNNCCAYVKRTARDLFGKEYPSNTDAWNMRYKCNSLLSSSDGVPLEIVKRLGLEGKIQPGMLLGIENPTSSYRNREDITGKKVQYTHIAVVLGAENNQLYIAHQLGSNQHTKESIEMLKKRGYKVREVLMPKK